MARRFEDRVTLVTGAASGIGRATALALGREGARVVCADLDAGGLDATRAKLADAGAETLGVECDVADPASARNAVEAGVKHFGRLDVLCNVAGVGAFHRSEELDPAEWAHIVAVNLNGTFFVTRAALPHLLDQTKGRDEAKGRSIVNVASVAGLRGQAYSAAYCASKAGVVSLTRSLALEFAGRCLRVNCVCPGGVRTPILGRFQPPEGADPALLARLSLVPRLIEPEEVALTIAFLASDAAGSINGVALPIDHGVSAG